MSSYEQAKSFCTNILSTATTQNNSNLPFVTLTYAQSLDGKISGSGGQQLTLSCKESMIMTHRLRTLHDGILVGIGTLLKDDPRLTARLIESKEISSVKQPQPIILDSKLRFPLTARLLIQSKTEEFKAPWIFTRQLSIYQILKILHSPPFSITQLMVEGGAKLIQSFLKSEMVNLLIITISPIFIGSNAISVTGDDNNDNFPLLTNIKYEKFGTDIVMVANILSTKKIK
ncbi:9154_t:CDS:2 [Diversispora eburnea]|uniref:2,5-diamino-6-ribosylamino-4(3H)-pyrimidinone 5'-phosphate reductase n=1 Tax=Diversispora eburnea TaxID=1213867 RepID=A0A9N9B914_9GLOM|nr:9154_t:CDS:2 [Diversispora eburnea]